MDQYFIVHDPVPQSTECAIEGLLYASKGYPQMAKSFQDLMDRPQCLYTLQKQTVLPSSLKVLGAVYWIDLAQLPKKWTSCMDLQPLSMPGQFPNTVRTWYQHSTKESVVGLPRFLGLSLFGPPHKDNRSYGHAIQTDCSIDLRPLQVQAVQQSLKSLEEWGGCTITADCGFGKTRLALGLISALKRRTLILCNRELLMQQWASVVQSLSPWTLSWLQGADSMVPSKRSKRFQQACDLGTDICIGSIETLIEAETITKAFLDSFGLVIVDEAHHLAAATLVHALLLVQ